MPLYFTRYVALFFSLLGCIALLEACGNDDNVPATVTLRGISLVPNAEAILWTANGEVLDDTLRYGIPSSRDTIVAGQQQLVYTLPNQVNPALTLNVTLNAEWERFSCYLIDSLSNVLAFITIDSLPTEMSGDTAYIRAIHASPDLPTIHVLAANSSDTIANALRYYQIGKKINLTVSPYQPLFAGSYALQLHNAADSLLLYTTPLFTLAGGNAYTVLFSGNYTPDTGNPFAVHLLNEIE